MEILFLNPSFKSEFGRFSRENRSAMITKSGTLYYPLWLLYAAGVADAEGFKVNFIDAPAKRFSEQHTINLIKTNLFQPRLIVIEVSTPSVYNDVAVGEHLKELFPNAFVLLVGVHPSAESEQTLRLSSIINAVGRHEFEYIVRDVAIALRDNQDVYQVKGLTYWKDGKIVHNEDMPLIENLDELPFVSKVIYKYLDINDYFFAAASYPEIQIFTGRGCPARCFFCVYPQVFHSHKYRERSARNVVDEFKFIAETFPTVYEVVIEDDTFTTNRKRVIEICKLLIQEKLHKRLKWLCNARVNLDYETMLWMKKAGCRLIIPGIESGSQEVLNAIRKGTTLKQVEQYIRDAKRAGLLVHACFMVGNRGETYKTMEQTLKFAMKLNTDTVQFYPLIPFPGTEAYNWAKENSYIRTLDYSTWVKPDGTHNCVLNLPEISAKELTNFCDYARKKYYLRPRYILYKFFQSLTNIQDMKRTVRAFVSIMPHLLKRIT